MRQYIGFAIIVLYAALILTTAEFIPTGDATKLSSVLSEGLRFHSGPLASEEPFKSYSTIISIIRHFIYMVSFIILVIYSQYKRKETIRTIFYPKKPPWKFFVVF